MDTADTGDTLDASDALDMTSTDSLFTQLWEANQAAFAGGDYETACDTLQAALARARFLRDVDLVTAVGQTADAQHRQLFGQASQEAYSIQATPHPILQDAIELVYSSLMRQAQALTTVLRVHS